MKIMVYTKPEGNAELVINTEDSLEIALTRILSQLKEQEMISGQINNLLRIIPKHAILCIDIVE